MLRICTFIHAAQEHDCREKYMIALLRIWGLFMGTRYVCKLVFFWGGGKDNICNSLACEFVFVGCLGSRSNCPVYTYYTWVCRTGRGNIWPSSILLITWRYERTYIHIYHPATEPERRENSEDLFFHVGVTAEAEFMNVQFRWDLGALSWQFTDLRFPYDAMFTLQTSFWARICKRLRSTGIDSKESILIAYVA